MLQKKIPPALQKVSLYNKVLPFVTESCRKILPVHSGNIGN